jgi:[acyl-carrier-protein] S-malonyltransferase
MKGIFHRADPTVGIGDPLPRSAAIGRVSNLRDTVEVTAPHGGTIVEWIVEDGDPVSPGAPLVRLHPRHEEATA